MPKRHDSRLLSSDELRENNSRLEAKVIKLWEDVYRPKMLEMLAKKGFNPQGAALQADAFWRKQRPVLRAKFLHILRAQGASSESPKPLHK